MATNPTSTNNGRRKSSRGGRGPPAADKGKVSIDTKQGKVSVDTKQDAAAKVRKWAELVENRPDPGDKEAVAAWMAKLVSATDTGAKEEAMEEAAAPEPAAAATSKKGKRTQSAQVPLFALSPPSGDPSSGPSGTAAGDALHSRPKRRPGGAGEATEVGGDSSRVDAARDGRAPQIAARADDALAGDVDIAARDDGALVSDNITGGVRPTVDEEWAEYDGTYYPLHSKPHWLWAARRVRVASDVDVIPEAAFAMLENLRTVDLNNVSTIPADAFNCCRSLERVVWTTASPVEIGENAFYFCRSLSEIDLGNVSKIGSHAFWNCKSLKRVVIPPYITEIESGAFGRCTKMTEVEFPEGINRIGDNAFFLSAALVRIRIPSSVRSIGDGAFLGESELREDEAFRDCTRLVEVELNEGLQQIGTEAFACSSMQSIDVPSSVRLIGPAAFNSCPSLSEVTLREGVHCIEYDAFWNCASLEHINIPPVAFVIDTQVPSCQLVRTATIPVPHIAVPQENTLVVSKWLQHRSPDQLAQAEAKVNEILNRNQQTGEEKVRSIREWFAYFNLVDVTMMLELAIWRCNMNGDERDAEARQARRENCGNDMNVIISGVLPFLEG